MKKKNNLFKSISTCFLLMFTAFSYGQIKVESIYKKEFKTVGKNEYARKLISLSTTKPIKNWDNYQGGAIDIDTSKYQFNNKALYQAFPTNYAIHRNKYLAFYFSQKEAKCPTLFSLLNYYQPIIDSNLHKHQLPDEIKFLPVVCSAFNPYSTNNIGGSGFWHLNYPQAIKYGLRVDDLIDERRDFEKSTQAATAYLKDLYSIYQNWELAITAYASGVTTVNKYLKRNNGNTYKDIYNYLPNETKDLVEAFVAMNYIYNYDNYGAVQLNLIIEKDSLIVDKELHFKALKDILLADIKEITFLNITINRAIIPEHSTIFLPSNLKQKFNELKDSIFFYQDSILLKPIKKTPKVIVPKDGEPFTYKVRSGDVLGLIANRYNVRVSQLQDWNNIRGTRINVGQELTIYGKKSSKKKKEQKKTNKKPNPQKNKRVEKPNQQLVKDYSIYTVKSGESLWLIAKKFSGVSAQNIMDFNNIGNNLKVGQVLKIPKY